MTNTNDGNSNDTPVGLTIKPYAVQVYSKTSNENRYVTLIYRREVKTISASAPFAESVLQDIAESGGVSGGKVTIILTPEKGGRSFRCLLEIPLEAAPR